MNTSDNDYWVVAPVVLVAPVLVALAALATPQVLTLLVVSLYHLDENTKVEKSKGLLRLAQTRKL